MKRASLIVAVFIGLVACTWFLVAKTRRLEVRVAKLEALIATSTLSAAQESPAGFEVRLARLEAHVATLDETLGKNIVRQGLDGKLKERKDMPPGF